MKSFGSQTCSSISVFVMNQDDEAADIKICLNGTIPSTSLRPAPAFVTLAMGLNKYYSHTIPAHSTTVFRFDGCGNILDKYVYTINDNLNNLAPQRTDLAPDLARFCHNCTFENRISCTSNESNFYENFTFSSSDTLADSAWFSGLCKVPNGVTLSIDNAEIVFGAGSKLLVEPGGRLFVNGSFLHSCEEAWLGLEVIGTGDTTQRLAMYQSKIENASYPVKASSTSNTNITECTFQNGITAITLHQSKGFTVHNSEISDFDKGISTDSSYAVTAAISNNYLSNIDEGVRFSYDNHSLLDVHCNVFQFYTDYGIYSANSTVKDQGDSIAGAGNYFETDSAHLNHQFRHDGNLMTYYLDTSHIFTLDTTTLNARAVRSESDGCNNNHAPLSMNPQISSRAGETLVLAPNPAAHNVTILYPPVNGRSELCIRDAFGRIVLTKPLTEQSTQTDLDLASFQNGIYFVSVIINGTFAESKKLIISK
jgi:hypothetical protein